MPPPPPPATPEQTAADKAGLLAFKAAGDPANVLQGWDAGTDPCGAGWNNYNTGWVGLRCYRGEKDGEGGRVNDIYLFNKAGLRGSIESLAKVSSLTYLDVHGCSDVVGDVASLVALTDLQRLRVSNTAVTGSIEPLAVLTKSVALAMSKTAVTGSIEPFAVLEEIQTFWVADTDVHGNSLDITSVEGLSSWGSDPNDFTSCETFDCPTSTYLFENAATTVGRDICACCAETTMVRNAETGVCYDAGASRTPRLPRSLAAPRGARVRLCIADLLPAALPVPAPIVFV